MKKCLLILLIAFSARTAFAQDPHFSQFFASPLTLNPAFTGLFSGDYRVAANYRSQWYTISTPFTTGTVSLDFPIMKNIIPVSDIWGVGVLALYDQTGGGGLMNTYFSASTAYHKALDGIGNQTLAIGFQAAYVQKRLDFSKLKFENQLTNQGFDPTLPSGEYFNNSNFSYPDFNVGVLYNGLIGESSNVYFGASYYHITTPNESFLGENNKLSSRYTVHGGGGFPINTMLRLYASALYMGQGSATEITAGGALGVLVNGLPNDPTTLYIGSWMRYNDAINPYVGLEIGDFHVGVSYDINISSLKSASQSQGGMEISLIYTHQHQNDLHKWNCPKF